MTVRVRQCPIEFVYAQVRARDKSVLREIQRDTVISSK
jgi:hypothetical protein